MIKTSQDLRCGLDGIKEKYVLQFNHGYYGVACPNQARVLTVAKLQGKLLWQDKKTHI
jgi:hypothetical protein